MRRVRTFRSAAVIDDMRTLSEDGRSADSRCFSDGASEGSSPLCERLGEEADIVNRDQERGLTGKD